MLHRKTLLGRKNSLLHLLSLPQLFPESDSLLHMRMLLSYSGRPQKGLLHQEGSQRSGCSTLPALSFFGWHNASEFHRTQLQKTCVWIISKYSHFAEMRTSTFKSVLFLPFSLETIKQILRSPSEGWIAQSENDIAQVNDVSQLGFLLL